MRSLLTIAVLAVSLAAAGCSVSTTSESSQPTSSSPAPIDVNDPSALKQATDIEADLPVGSTVTIGYERKAEYTTVPYLAVKLVAATTPAKTTPEGDQEVTVTGAFPGTPQVYVVDKDYAIIPTTSSAAKNADGTTTTTTLVPLSADGLDRTILVHDAMWSLPMQFDVAIGH